MSEFQLENNVAEFLKREIRKEVQTFKSLDFPIHITVDRIFALIAMAATRAVPKCRAPAKPDFKIFID